MKPQKTSSTRKFIFAVSTAVCPGVILLLIDYFLIGIIFTRGSYQPINITASVDNPNPPQYSTVKLLVILKDENNNLVSDAIINAIAHYRTTSMPKLGHTEEYDDTTISFSIGPASIGYEVKIEVKARKNKSIGSAQTSFTPISRKD